MRSYPRHVALDRAAFAPDAIEPDARYGLPTRVEFCSRCVISNQRPSSAREFQPSVDAPRR